MSGTLEGGRKARDTNYKLHGKDFYAKIGKLGGAKSVNKGFASMKRGEDGLTGPERARLVGAIGGLTSRRGPAKEVES